MQPVDIIKSWLMTFPLWEEGDVLLLDRTGPAATDQGLYSQGLEETDRRRDIQGNVTLFCRRQFLLCRRGPAGPADDGDNARWLEALEDWVQAQSALGLAPRLGDDPARERLRVGPGQLRQRSGMAQSVYHVPLTAEFVRFFKASEA